jgi:hypothetical protein
MRQNLALVAFNRGLVSKLGLARGDLKRVALSAQVQTNWMPRKLGSMMLRPGLAFTGQTKSNLTSRNLPFVFATNDTARIELTNLVMRVWVDDVLVTRTAVTTAIANGSFDANLTSWTDDDEAGGTSAWVTGGYMGLTGNGTAAAIRTQSVAVIAADQAVEHALKILIQRGPVTLRVGTTSGGDELIGETSLDTGMHSLAFTPNAATIYVRFQSRLKRQVLVDSCNVEAAGAMELATPWTAADLDLINGGTESQSGDIIFCACDGFQQRKIERRGDHSWSVVRYQAEGGPLELTNTGPITITPSALSGNITLTASAALFKSTHAPSTDNDGAMFRITSSGQRVTASVTAQNQFTNAILVEGVDAQRVFTVIASSLSGTGSTITLQRSLTGESGPWADVSNYTTDQTITHDDGLDNQEAWYRIGCKTGNYVAGTIAVELNYTIGSVDGIVRITAFSTSLSVSAEVLEDLGGTSATDDWAEGSWSDRRGWPTSGTFYEGRLEWAGRNGAWLSISDNFYGFDETTEGDSGPIARTIGSGPVDVINWSLPLQRLVLGAEGAEFSCRSSSLDEPLTPTNFNIKTCSSQGSSYVQAVKVDNRGLYVNRGGTKVFELDTDPNTGDYMSSDMTALIPEIGEPEIVRMAVQRLPDTRVHCVLSNGSAAVLIYDKLENVACWIRVTTAGASGTIEDVVVLPAATGSTEDQVYYQTKRTVNGSTIRAHEKWAMESECRLDSNDELELCKLGDAHVTYTGAAVTNVPAGTASHLVGQSVVVWADGVDVGTVDGSDGSVTYTYTVAADGSLSAALPAAATNIMIGLPYDARFQSGKLVQLVAQLGTPLNQTRNIKGLGLIMSDVHRRGILYGRDFTTMRDLPSKEGGATVDDDAIRAEYDAPSFPFPGQWSTDERVCLLARAPRPVVVLAAVAEVDTRE